MCWMMSDVLRFTVVTLFGMTFLLHQDRWVRPWFVNHQAQALEGK